MIQQTKSGIFHIFHSVCFFFFKDLDFLPTYEIFAIQLSKVPFKTIKLKKYIDCYKCCITMFQNQFHHALIKSFMFRRNFVWNIQYIYETEMQD